LGSGGFKLVGIFAIGFAFAAIAAVSLVFLFAARVAWFIVIDSLGFRGSAEQIGLPIAEGGNRVVDVVALRNSHDDSSYYARRVFRTLLYGALV
jgi:hypothetical protein